MLDPRASALAIKIRESLQDTSIKISSKGPVIRIELDINTVERLIAKLNDADESSSWEKH